jgi:hypothetical protein
MHQKGMFLKQTVFAVRLKVPRRLLDRDIYQPNWENLTNRTYPQICSEH